MADEDDGVGRPVDGGVGKRLSQSRFFKVEALGELHFGAAHLSAPLEAWAPLELCFRYQMDLLGRSDGDGGPVGEQLDEPFSEGDPGRSHDFGPGELGSVGVVFDAVDLVDKIDFGGAAVFGALGEGNVGGWVHGG